MIVEDLVLEITRKCNLSCRHCLRGPAQRLTMSTQVLNNTLMHISHIGMVTFTGGEPSLATEVIEQFVQTCWWRHISVGSFFMYTNGKAHNGLGRFIRACDKLYGLCDEQGACAVSISQDQYHRELRDIQWHRYEIRDEETGYSYGEYPPYFHHTPKENYIDQPFNEGRAQTNGLGWKPPRQQKPFEVEDHNGELYIKNDDGQVFIAANGNVVSTCNLSFHRVDKESKGNVLTTPLSQIIESYCVREEEIATAVA